MSIDISSRFNYERLFRFVLPSVVMMIFISTYTMVDGFFPPSWFSPVSDSCSAQAAAPS